MTVACSLKYLLGSLCRYLAITGITVSDRTNCPPRDVSLRNLAHLKQIGAVNASKLFNFVTIDNLSEH